MKLLKFSATWCQPCKMLSKVMEDAAGKIEPLVEEIDIDQNMELARQYNVRGVPTLILLDSFGKEVKRHSGMMMENELLKFLGE